MRRRNRPNKGVGSYGVIFDDAGSLWIASLGDGVGRIRFTEGLKDSKTFQQGAEIFSDKNGLTSNYAAAVLEDREGNIWLLRHRIVPSEAGLIVFAGRP